MVRRVVLLGIVIVFFGIGVFSVPARSASWANADVEGLVRLLARISNDPGLLDIVVFPFENTKGDPMCNASLYLRGDYELPDLLRDLESLIPLGLMDYQDPRSVEEHRFHFQFPCKGAEGKLKFKSPKRIRVSPEEEVEVLGDASIALPQTGSWNLPTLPGVQEPLSLWYYFAAGLLILEILISLMGRGWIPFARG